MRGFLKRAGTLFLFATLCGKSLGSHAAEDDLPFGVYPNIDEVQDAPRPVGSLGTEIKDLGGRVQDTIKQFAERRNFRCLGGPCLVQAFPLLYSKPNSGFFGGFRANIARPVPGQELPAFSTDISVVRSDTAQWLTYFANDVPVVPFLPLKPRLQVRSFYSRTTETRYYGIGPASSHFVTAPDSEVRYGLTEAGLQFALIIPVIRIADQRLNVFSSFSTIHDDPAPFDSVSKLFADKPTGIQGGFSSRAGLGFLVDSRDRENLPRQGWMTEVSAEVAGNPLGAFKFQRISLIDRRYFSMGNYTIANRFTFDMLTGAPPFWELRGVGGVDPVQNVAGSPLLRGYSGGRFHELRKTINSLELRWQMPRQRILGQLADISLIPIGADVGRLGQQNAFSVSTGFMGLFNRSFLVSIFVARSRDHSSLSLDFDRRF